MFNAHALRQEPHRRWGKRHRRSEPGSGPPRASGPEWRHGRCSADAGRLHDFRRRAGRGIPMGSLTTRPLAWSILLLSILATRGHAGICTVPLRAVGPTSPVHGFPEYYLDSNGLALAPCLDLACDPALVLPDPTRPAAFPGNFPDEFFYFRALADLASGGATARLTLAL